MKDLSSFFRIIPFAFFSLFLLCACESVQPAIDIGAAAGVASGFMSQTHADSLKKTGTAMGKSFQDITPEQEYYIGRAVAATILAQYAPYNDEQANLYLNVLGQTLAQASDRPNTFGGYHFLIIDSPEINAFAAPGGLILITRGMLQCCKTEDALAAVLAHEIGHIQGQHGLKAIKTSRLTTAFSLLASEGMKSYGPSQLGQLTEAFEGSVSDVVATLVNNGYSRDLEQNADDSAIIILNRVGYDPRALAKMLTVMNGKLQPNSPGFGKTHPDPKERIQRLPASSADGSAASTPPARQKRFERNLGSVLHG